MQLPSLKTTCLTGALAAAVLFATPFGANQAMANLGTRSVHSTTVVYTYGPGTHTQEICNFLGVQDCANYAQSFCNQPQPDGVGSNGSYGGVQNAHLSGGECVELSNGQWQATCVIYCNK